MTGEDLGYKPGVIEKAKFEYSTLGKVSNKGLEESDKKERLLKRLKNIAGKNKEQLEEIEYQGERQLDMINKQGKKQLNAFEKQLKKIKYKKVKKEEKPEKIVFLKDTLYDTLMGFDMNFMDKGRNILKKLARDKRLINYNNLLFRTSNPIIKNFDFLKRFGTLYDLLIGLLSENKQ